MSRTALISRSVAIILLLCLFHSTSQAQSTLRWKLKKGQVLHYNIVEEAKLGSDKRGLTQKLVMDTTWTVSGTKEDTWQIRVDVNRIRFTASGAVNVYR
jgi:hypothetical protein